MAYRRGVAAGIRGEAVREAKKRQYDLERKKKYLKMSPAELTELLLSAEAELESAKAENAVLRGGRK